MNQPKSQVFVCILAFVTAGILNCNASSSIEERRASSENGASGETTSKAANSSTLDTSANSQTGKSDTSTNYEAGVEEDSKTLAPPNDLKVISEVSIPYFTWQEHPSATRYQIAIGTNPGSTDIIGWKDVGNKLEINVQELGLEKMGTMYVSVRSVDENDNFSEAIQLSESWYNFSCPKNYVKITGNLTPGLGGDVYSAGSKTRRDGSLRETASFCVMKYEARQGDNDVAISEAQPNPWTSLFANDAVAACQRNGDHYDLINNNQWQTIARAIEATNSNWREGTQQGSANNMLNMGNIVSNGNGAPYYYVDPPSAASNEDKKACINISKVFGSNNTDTECNGQAWHVHKRTHNLPNGEVIWDMGGHAGELVPDVFPTDLPGTDGTSYAVDYNFPGYTKLAFGSEGDHSGKQGTLKGGLGTLWFAGNPTPRPIVRGWSYSNTAGGIEQGPNMGVFSANEGPRTVPSRFYGFRCVYAP